MLIDKLTEHEVESLEAALPALRHMLELAEQGLIGAGEAKPHNEPIVAARPKGECWPAGKTPFRLTSSSRLTRASLCPPGWRHR